MHNDDYSICIYTRDENTVVVHNELGLLMNGQNSLARKPRDQIPGRERVKT